MQTNLANVDYAMLALYLIGTMGLGVYTIPELMERRFNVGVRTLLGTCWLVFMACNLGIMLVHFVDRGFS